MTRPAGPDGIVVIDKAAGWTSHDVVAKARGLLGTRKIGHAGTLDPGATGVLVLGVGRATRLLRFVTDTRKTYTCEIVVGTETTTYDDDGEIVATYPTDGVTLEAARSAAAALTGDIAQVPPMVSAIKVDGRRLHELARAGVEIERAPRPVTVYRFDIDLDTEPAPGEPMVLRAAVECSSGTYVRSLAHDLGRALGGGAHLRHLRREAVGPFVLADAVPLESLGPECLRPVGDAVGALARLDADDEVSAAVRHGKVLPAATFGPDVTGPVAVFDPSGALLAVYEPHRTDQMKPTVVVAAAG